MTDGSVVVTYLMAEQPMIQDVQVIGNRELSDQELLKQVTVLAGTPVDRFQIDRSARSIEDLYRTKGYYRVRVAIDEKDLADSGIVVFRVIEGDRVKVTDIRFEGNVNFSAKELRTVITTSTYFPIFDKGPLDDDVLAVDKRRWNASTRTAATSTPAPTRASSLRPTGRRPSSPSWWPRARSTTFVRCGFSTPRPRRSRSSAPRCSRIRAPRLSI
jgi:hypothetical protein